MTIMLTAVVLNCLLNPLFIFGFGWGIRGSAAATVLAKVAALSVSLIHFSSRGSFIRFERGIFRLQASVVGKIFSIGMASFLLHLCASAVVIVVNKSLREYGGDVAIGAYGIIYRVAMLFLLLVSQHWTQSLLISQDLSSSYPSVLPPRFCFAINISIDTDSSVTEITAAIM